MSGLSPLVAEAARHLSAGKLAQAAECANRALAIKPTDADALQILGVIAAQQGRSAPAIGYLERVVALKPKDAGAHFNLACLYHQARAFDRAEPHYRHALRLQPRSAQYHCGLGALLLDKGEVAAARERFEAAVACEPANEQAVLALYGAARFDGAMDLVERISGAAVKRWPQGALHWLYRGEALFALGRLAEGWDCYAWRFKAPQHAPISRAVPDIASWAGEDLTGKSVLVWTEQGPGDEAMYTTMLEDVKAKVGRLSVLCSARMAPLLRRTYPDIAVHPDTVPPEVRGQIEVQAPLIDFARIVRPALSAFPRPSPRLRADAKRVAQLRSRYLEDSDDLLIGIAWRSKDVQDAQQKSVNLGVWGPLFALPGVRFVNLQYGDCTREISAIKSEFGVTVIQDAGIDALADLDAFAAQVSAMDVVVSSSNTAAHFAGALGVETHCMLPATAGRGRRWYWFERQRRAAWYDDVRLWTQTKPGQWDDVVRDVTLAVAAGLKGRRPGLDADGFFERLAEAYRRAGARASRIAVLEAWSAVPGSEARGFFELGHFAKSEGRASDALACFERALGHAPNFAAALNMKGVVLAAAGDYAGAEDAYRRAISAAPEMPEPLNNLAATLHRLGRGADAAALYAEANARTPDQPAILHNLATNLAEIGRGEDAMPFFERLLRLQPDDPAAHCGLAYALLSAGRFREGWPELLWRRRLPPPPGQSQSVLFSLEDQLPRWNGEDLNGKRVLVLGEHGLGDQIMTATIIPDLVAAAGRVGVICDPRLIKLLRRSLPAATVFDEESWRQTGLADFDFQISLSELGEAFRATVADFGRRSTLLTPDPDTTAALRSRYGAGAGVKLIGLSWASRNPEIGGLKALSLRRIVEALAPLKDHARFISLQYGDYNAELDAVRAATGLEIVHDPAVDHAGDMDGPAAQVAAMDAVVTISNTTAHLAGALGVPTHLLLPHGRGRHWYWLRAFAHCPWYPSVSYLSQASNGDWEPALAALGRAYGGRH